MLQLGLGGNVRFPLTADIALTTGFRLLAQAASTRSDEDTPRSRADFDRRPRRDPAAISTSHAFPPAVIAEAEAAVKRPLSDHIDKTEMHFVTLDPASSMDLDQPFSIELRGAYNIGPMSAFDPKQTLGYGCYEAAGEIRCECTG